ncbi:2TM domain-containing protein [Flavobacterium sp. LC2016-12]|uniref:2TM domain-containing protein n=1 Tax=Flavobacterium sp. LC2016-12 TaxID=2783794 RepID=UPI00188A2C6A|nr:2TM domain-containing protein [Flavobacterium sp. LC2016-12]MBF4465475.1 2TM domain-containing protein [Flavobacterium sp. LC2016-12]
METNCNYNQEKFKFEAIFSKKIVKLRSFYLHAFIYAIGLIIYVLKEFYGISLNFFPMIYLNSVVMIIWTSVFLVSAIDLFAYYKIFGEEWEERKLKNILDKRTKTQKWE